MVTPNWMTNEFIIKESVMGGASIAALSQQGDILALRLGCVRNRDQVELSKGHRKVTIFSDWSTQSCTRDETHHPPLLTRLGSTGLVKKANMVGENDLASEYLL